MVARYGGNADALRFIPADLNFISQPDGLRRAAKRPPAPTPVLIVGRGTEWMTSRMAPTRWQNLGSRQGSPDERYHKRERGLLVPQIIVSDDKFIF